MEKRVIVLLILAFVFSLVLTFDFSGRLLGITGGDVGTGRVIETSLIVPEKYQNMQAGGMLNFQLQLEEPGKAGRHDISLEYYIKKNDITINYRKEIKAIETQASFLASIKVPEETLPGLYTIEVSVNGNKAASSSFYVKSSEIVQVRVYLFVLAIIILTVGILISWELSRLRRVEEKILRKR